MLKHMLIASFPSMLLFMPTAASAGYGAATCPILPISSTACRGVCTYATATDTWTCDVSIFSGSPPWPSYGATIVAERTAMDYSAFGTDGAGGFWLCEIDSTSTDPIEKIVLYGHNNDDDLCFQDDTTDLHPAGYVPTLGLTAYMHGLQEDDRMLGSPDTSADYVEHLYGGYGTDTIVGDDGDDHLYGGEHDDRICGNAGDDEIWGGNDADILLGGAGVDKIYGEDGNDQLLGGADGDTLEGGPNNDDLIGEGGTDTLKGDAGDDDLIYDVSVDTADGGANYDYCSDVTDTNCESATRLVTWVLATCPY